MSHRLAIRKASSAAHDLVCLGPGGGDGIVQRGEQGSNSTDVSAAGLGDCPAVTADGLDATEARQAATAVLLDLVNRWYDLLERAVDAAMAGEMLPAGERRRTAALCCAGFDEAYRRWETALHIEYQATGRYPGVVGGQAAAMSSWLRSMAPGAGTG